MKTEPRSIVRTGLGNLVFRLLDPFNNPANSAHSISLFPIQQALPKGMSVQASTAALLMFTPSSEEERLIFSCSWEPPFNVKGGAESGERLDAQSWQHGGIIVVVGTEDYEALGARLPECGFSEADYPVHYLPNGFEVMVPQAPAGKEISLHFVVAENSFPEPVESSAWFAVDIEHPELRKWS